MNKKQAEEKAKEIVAQGWCDPENSSKVMDADLAFSIASKVSKALLEAQRETAEECAKIIKEWDGDSHYFKSEVSDFISKRFLGEE